MPIRPLASALRLVSSQPLRRQQPLHNSTARMMSAASSDKDAAAPKPKPETLPAPARESTAPTIDISGSGSTVSLDALGPIVVNKDGTVARVSNWQAMTEAERETTLRVLGKRNQQRLKALKEAGVEVKGLGKQTL